VSTRTVRTRRISFRVDIRTSVVCLGLLLATLVVAVVAISTGDYRIPVPEVVRTLFGGGTRATSFIIETLRLPRVLTGALVGAALGCSGAIFQSLSRNPLGSPDIIGFTTGAATGAVLEILIFHGSTIEIAGGAVVGGVATALAVYLLAFKRGVQGYRLILIGIGVSAMLASVNSYLLTRANINDAENAQVWLTGSLNGRGWEHVRPISVALALLLPAAFLLGRQLRLLEMGDDAARALGVRAERSRLSLLLVGVALTGVAVAAAGPVAFVALAAPQLAHRLTRAPGVGLLSSALMGMFLLTISDYAAQRVYPSIQLPVGVATGAVGGLYLAWLLANEWRSGRA
jgi:iron complex transport system permease protein